MTIERIIRGTAGSIVLISLALSLASPYWLILTALVGLNLVQSAFTDWCPLITILEKAGFKRCS